MRSCYARSVGALASKAVSFVERTPLFGRGREIARLVSSLEEGERLVTVTGPSGMGKTRLVLRVAREVSSTLAVAVARLASAKSRANAQGEVARALGIVPRQGLDLAVAIADRGPLLLVLDNVEHLVPEILPLLEAWLDHCPDLRILSSSIVPLGIEGEMRFELGPLAVDDAVALYLDRARRAAADRESSDGEIETIRELVQRLDGLPLAIELAAARVRILPPRQLLTRIHDRFALLQREGKGRHGSLWHALSLSWEHLSPAERTTLARASVFERGFDWDAAESILWDDAFEGESILGLVDGLRAKALVQVDDEGETPRFSLYESVRAFAARQLESMGLEEDALLRHARYYVDRAEQASERCHGPDAPQAIRWLLAERENLLAVQRRLAERAPGLASRAGIALAEVLALNGPPSLEEEVLTASIRLAAAGGEARLEGKAHWCRARAYKRLGRLVEGLADVDAGLVLARSCGDAAMEGRLLLEAGAIRFLLGHHEEALRDLSVARDIGEREGIPEFEGIASLIRGVGQENQGRNEEAYDSFVHALEIFRAVGHLRYQGVALLNIGAVASHLGRFDEARRSLVESRRIFRLLENPASEANVLLNLGGVSLAEGKLDQAAGWLKKVLTLERQLGNPRVRGLALAGMAHVALETESPQRAAALMDDALALLRPLKEWRYVSIYLPFYALCIGRLGRREEAWKVMREARDDFERVRDEASLETIALLEELMRLEEAIARQDAEAARCPARKIEATLAVPVQGASTEATFIARRLARRELERLAPPSGEAVLRVGPEAAWFECAGSRVDLRRRGAVRRMFRALVENRIAHPGAGMSAEALVEVGWPRERILPEAAATRVYSGIRTLRSLGLEGILLRHADGYLLDPDVEIAWA